MVEQIPMPLGEAVDVIEPARDQEAGGRADTVASPVTSPVAEAPAMPSFVYALGTIEPRFPSLAIEKEFAQVAARTDQSGLTDRQVFRSVIDEENNQYLVRRLCWVFLVEGLETYLLLPRETADFRLLREAYRDSQDAGDVDVVIGVRTQLAPPDACNGLVLPIVVFDQLYSFSKPSLIDAIPVPETFGKAKQAQFREASSELFDAIRHVADNAGATDEHRALNYLTVRYPNIYALAAEQQNRNASMSKIDVRTSRLSGARKIVDVIFTFTHRQTDVQESHFLRVDVTEEYPYLVSRLTPYFET